MRKMRWPIAVLAGVGVVFLVLGVAGFGPVQPLLHRPISADAHGGIVRVELVPIPEGPAAEEGSETKLANEVRRYIPNPLPAPLGQGFCGGGGDLVVTFADGTKVTYGPCRRPPSINHLWAEIIYVTENGQCAPRCGPGGAPGP